MTEFEGKVVKKIIGKGSKSEHDAVMLVTKDGEYRLRRQKGNPFHDPELEKLIGKTIRCDGVKHNLTFIMNEFEELTDTTHSEAVESVVDKTGKVEQTKSDDDAEETHVDMCDEEESVDDGECE